MMMMPVVSIRPGPPNSFVLQISPSNSIMRIPFPSLAGVQTGCQPCSLQKATGRRILWLRTFKTNLFRPSQRVFANPTHHRYYFLRNETLTTKGGFGKDSRDYFRHK